MPTNQEVEVKVREAFPDSQDMVTIAKCESGFRQFNSNGDILRSNSGSYIGIFQIDENIHAAHAKNLGHDIYTIEGNIGYARHMYNQSGTRPWKGCLKSPSLIVTTNTTPEAQASANSMNQTLTANLKYGIIHPQVVILQKLLNQAGFKITASGPGSPGNETNKFGALTKEALKKFQCTKGIVCSGTENTTGYGYAGPKTRAALNELAK